MYPESGWRDDNAFIAFDPDVRFLHFHMERGDGTIGNVHLAKGKLQSGQSEWSMTVSLPGPRYGRPTGGVEGEKVAAGRRVIEVYRHYLSTRPEQYRRA